MMIRHLSIKACLAVALVILAGLPTAASAGIMNFNEWSIVEDPAHANFSSSVDSSSQITLSATGGAIPAGTDIGYQSVDGADVASSTSGWAFDPAFDFAVAVDYDLSFISPIGGFSIGMGIGEDQAGTDSAGIFLASLHGGFLTFAGAARDNDSLVASGVLGYGGISTGRFIISYDSASGNVTAGVSGDGDDTPDGIEVLSGVQNLWDEEALLVSFFARGDNGEFDWDSGTADAVFTNFHVISGSPLDVSQLVAVPEPTAILLGAIGLLALGLIGRRRMRESAAACIDG